MTQPRYVPIPAPAPDWTGAACAGRPTNLFFPKRTSDDNNAAPRAICATCPITTHCLNWAIDTHAEGVWGGTTEDERHTRRRDRKRTQQKAA